MSFRGNTVAAVGGGVAGLGVLPRGPNTATGWRWRVRKLAAMLWVSG